MTHHTVHCNAEHAGCSHVSEPGRLRVAGSAIAVMHELSHHSSGACDQIEHVDADESVRTAGSRSMQEDAHAAVGGSGQTAGCAEYVFGHYMGQGRVKELLQLPDDFNHALTAWLDSQVRMCPCPGCGC